MKKIILVTGGAGFIGHHIVEGLLKNTDWDIVILDCINYAGNLNRLPDVNIFEKEKDRIRFVYHDLRSEISSETHQKIGKLDFVYHLAAESHVDRSLENPIPFIESNVKGTANLLMYLKKQQPDVKKIAIFSTDEVFGPAPENVYYKEGDVCNPSNPYSASKEGQEAIAKAFAFSFGLPIVITRTMNVFGERQNPEKFMPKTMRSLLLKEKITLHGSSPEKTSSRCWIHARNVESALRFILDREELIEKKFQDDKQRGIYHIVGEEHSVFELADKICRIIRGAPLNSLDVEFIDFHQCRPGHDFRYALSGEKLKNLGWKPDLDFDSSFEKMTRWMISPENKDWLNI